METDEGIGIEDDVEQPKDHTDDIVIRLGDLVAALDGAGGAA